MKSFLFHGLAWAPLVILVAVLVFFTNLPQRVYLHSIRDIYFACLDFVPDDYVYKAKPGPCPFANLEFTTVLNHSADGFRNPDRIPGYDVAVLGDSIAHGWGVHDHETFAHLLGERHHYPAINLAIGSYATKRELDAFVAYGTRARYVVIQYCDNDASENAASTTLNPEAFRTHVETFWRSFIARYEGVKASGYRAPLLNLAGELRGLKFTWKGTWRRTVDLRGLTSEAIVFAAILTRYRGALEGKRVIVLESSTYGLNAPGFEAAFSAELSKLTWLRFKIVQTTRVLDYGDHYFLDGHLNAVGHRKLAAAIAADIASWETADLSLDRRPVPGR